MPPTTSVGQSTAICVTVRNEGSQLEENVSVNAFADGVPVGSTKYVPLYILEEFVKGLEESAKEENIDKSTIIRRFIAEGLREYKRERAARLYKEQRVSISGAAELAGLSLREMIDYLIRGGYKSRYSYEDLKREINILGTIKNNK